MRARLFVVAVAALACGKGAVQSQNLAPPADAGPDAGVPDSGPPDAGPPDAGPPDAGPPDAGPADAGPADAGPADAGPADAGAPDAGSRLGVITVAPDSAGWRFTSDGLPSGTVMGASMDEAGNLWVAGGTAGVFVQRAGGRSFQGFGIGDGLHPYGYLHGNIARYYGVPDGSPADLHPDLSLTPVISVAGGPPGVAFVGYQGKDNCESEWDAYGWTLEDHEKANPAVYKSGDADEVFLAGGGIAVWHFDISSGEGVVPAEPLGREKLCSVLRILYEHGSNRVWLGANHGFALGFADNAGVFEHSHPAVNDVHGWLMTDAYYGIALDPLGYLDKQGAPVHDVWFGGMIRTTRFRFGETQGDFWEAMSRTELYATGNASDISNDPAAQAAYWNRMDIWPDPVGERRDAAHGDWLASAPDAKNPADWDYDDVTGIAAMTDGDAWIGSHSNGLRQVDHDGHLIGDATKYLPSLHVGAVVRDPSDESVWIGYRDGRGVTRMMPDGSMIQYSGAALGANAGSAIWDIQVDTTGAQRRVIVAFRRGAVGIYSGP